MDAYLKINIQSLIKDKRILSIESKNQQSFTMIWLHGYGDTHLGFYEIFSENMNPFGENTKIVLPCAPLIKTKAIPSFQMNSWFDIEHMQTQDIRQNFDENGMNQAVEFIHQIIEHEVQFLNQQYDKVFLGGFSQGFMLALKTGLEFPIKLGGILGFCGLNFAFQDIHKNRLPLFVGISKNDSVISYSLAADSFQELEDARKHYNFSLYLDPISGHTISFQGYKKMEEFYGQLLKRYVTQK